MRTSSPTALWFPLHFDASDPSHRIDIMLNKSSFFVALAFLVAALLHVVPVDAAKGPVITHSELACRLLNMLLC